MKIKASFDDGAVQDIRAADEMSRFGIETIFYWPAYPELAARGSDRKSLNDDEMKQIADNFEIGSHTLTHPLLTRIPLERARVEINNSRAFLADKFGQAISSFCYPRGYANPQIEQMVVEAGYSSARGVTVGYFYESENPFYEQTTVHVGCDRKEYGGLSWIDYAMKMYKLARNSSKSVYHLWGHSWEIDKNNDWGTLRYLLKELTK